MGYAFGKRQSRRGNNQRFQRNSGAQRGANDVRRGAGDARVDGNQNDRWSGNASVRNDNNRGGNNDRGGGRWGRLEVSEANKNNPALQWMGLPGAAGKTASIKSQPK